MIKVWRFDDAPERYRNLSQHGGDEDWLAFVPSRMAEDWIGWLEEGTSFGVYRVSRTKVRGGVVVIGAHA
jgi:hypothetical protein